MDALLRAAWVHGVTGVTSVSGKGCHRDRKGRACHVLAAALAAVICVGTGLLPAPQAALSPAHLELVLEADTTPPW